MSTTSQPVLSLLPAPAPDGVERFRIEIRDAVTGTTAAAFAHANALARAARGNVTAVMDARAA